MLIFSMYRKQERNPLNDVNLDFRGQRLLVFIVRITGLRSLSLIRIIKPTVVNHSDLPRYFPGAIQSWHSWICTAKFLFNLSLFIIDFFHFHEAKRTADAHCHALSGNSVTNENNFNSGTIQKVYGANAQYFGDLQYSHD